MAAPSGLHRLGNKLADGSNNIIRQHGANYGSAETFPRLGYGWWHDPQAFTQARIDVLRNVWKINALRIPIDEGVFLGLPGHPSSTYIGANFRNNLNTVMDALIANDITPVPALIWTHPETAWNGGNVYVNQFGDYQGVLPSAVHYNNFFTTMGNLIKDRTSIILDVYGEPRLPNTNGGASQQWNADARTAAWGFLKGGCNVQDSEHPGTPVHAVAGIDQCIAAFRATGAQNFLWVPGISAGKDLLGAKTTPIVDSLNNYGYAPHNYGNRPSGDDGINTESWWDSNQWNAAGDTYPLAYLECGEFGDSTYYSPRMINWMDSKGGVGYYFWDFRVAGSSHPSLITDYNGTPSTYGRVVYDFYRANPIGTPSPTPDTTVPTVSFTAPASGATVGGVVAIVASASDNVGVARVEFYVGGVKVGEKINAPYTFDWDSTGTLNGAATLGLRAVDLAGNVSTTATRSVTVANGAGAGGLEPVVIGPFTVASMTLTSISPTTMARDAASKALTATGTGFAAGDTIEIGGEPVPTAYASATSLTATVTDTVLSRPGTQAVRVVRPTGEATASVTLTVPASAGAPVDLAGGTLNPARLRANQGSAWVTVTVPTNRFQAGDIGHVNGQARTTEYLAATQVRLQLTAADLTLGPTGIRTPLTIEVLRED
jgi:endoglucanase